MRALLPLLLACGLGASLVACDVTPPEGEFSPAPDAGVEATDGGGDDAGTTGDDAGITVGLDGGAEEPNPPPTGAEPPPPPGSADPCAAGASFQTGDHYRLIQSAGGPRWYYLHVPPGYTPAPTSVVLNFHGYSSDPLQQALLSKMNGHADTRGFIAVYPAGINRAWNAGLCCGDPAWVTRVDDMQFVRDTLDAVARELCVDKKRVFSTGMSNGGFLSHRLACELSDRIAAIAPVAGVMGVAGCSPPRQVPVFQFHGTEDALVPYYGGSTLGFPSVPATVGAWELRNGCFGALQTFYEKGDSTCVRRAGCPAAGDTRLCRVEGGGHTWPGGTPVPALGYTTEDLDATAMMLDFFEQHPMP